MLIYEQTVQYNKILSERKEVKKQINGKLNFKIKYQMNVRPTAATFIPQRTLSGIFILLLCLVHYHFYIYVLILYVVCCPRAVSCRSKYRERTRHNLTQKRHKGDSNREKNK